MNPMMNLWPLVAIGRQNLTPHHHCLPPAICHSAVAVAVAGAAVRAFSYDQPLCQSWITFY